MHEKLKNKIMIGNVIDQLRLIPDESINMIMTSPPYWGLRDYNYNKEFDTEDEADKLIHTVKDMQKQYFTEQPVEVLFNKWSETDKETKKLKWIVEIIFNTIWDDQPDCKHEWSAKYVSKIQLQAGNPDFKRKWREQASSKSNNISSSCVLCGAWKGQLGLEPTFQLYIDHLLQVIDECHRVLRKDGTMWLNLGDTWMGGNLSVGQPKDWKSISTSNKSSKYDSDAFNEFIKMRNKISTVKRKSLVMIPHRVAIAMIDRGWVARNDIDWQKPNPMPSSATDRFTSDSENIFLFGKSSNYYFKQQFESIKVSSIKRERRGVSTGNKLEKGHHFPSKNPNSVSQKRENVGYENLDEEINARKENGRNMRTTWTIATKAFKGAHFATYPETLPKIPIDAGCPKRICTECDQPVSYKFNIKKIDTRPGTTTGTGKSGKRDDPNKGLHNAEISSKRQIYVRDKMETITCDCNAPFRRGIVLDPFMGSGTTAVVAENLDVDWLGIELSPIYARIAHERIQKGSTRYAVPAGMKRGRARRGFSEARK